MYAPAALPFLLLIHFCDRGRRLSVAAIDALHNNDAGLPSRSAKVQRWLDVSRREYAALWKAYTAGGWKLDADRIAALITAEIDNRPDEAEDMIGGLRQIAQRFFKAQFGKTPSATAALAELDHLIARCRKQPALAADQTAGDQPSALRPLDASAMHWTGGRLDLVCRAVRDETHDVKTFSFEGVKPAVFCHRPGQAATLELPIDGKIVRRSYTISSSPSRPYLLEFTIKRVPGGLVSNWMHEHMRPGVRIAVGGPHGKFNCVDVQARRYLMLSAGSGITPTMAMTRWLCDTMAGADIVFLHYARTPRDLIYDAELRALAAGGRIRLVDVCGAVQPEDRWTGPTGGISPQQLRELVPDAAERTAMVCGPKGFMDKAKQDLAAVGCPPDGVHTENFSPPPAAAPAVAADVPVASVMLQSDPARRIRAAHGQVLLDALLESGVDAAHSCRAGSCGTCKLRVARGVVDMPACDGLSDEERKLGYVLACSSRVTGDLTLEM
jgi:ferredoxin-NADP reductase